jgi:DNA-binding NtrC family response regulator
VRELKNALDRAALLCEDDAVGAADLPLPASDAAPEAVPDLAVDSVSAVSLDRAERAAIERVLRKTSGRRGEAARLLGISEPTLRRKIRRYGLDEG